MYCIRNYLHQTLPLSTNRKKECSLFFFFRVLIFFFFFVIFRNIPAQGQYDVYATTPGCVGSSNCFTRTQVEYLLELSPGFPVTAIISDQNTFTDNRILLYSGYISPVSTDFRPSITLRPAPNATKPSNNSPDVQIMADTIEFVRNVTATPLVSILEYNPANATNTTNTTVISWKPLNRK